MELNIASSSKPVAVFQKGSGPKKKVKGGWKKRRLEHVIQRAKAKRCSKLSNEKKMKDKSIRVDEFESGVLNLARGAAANPSFGEVNPVKKRRRDDVTPDYDSIQTGTDHASKPIVSNIQNKLQNFHKRPKPTNSANPVISAKLASSTKSGISAKPGAIDKADQTPAAVNATLQVLGSVKPLPNSTNPEGTVSHSEYPDITLTKQRDEELVVKRTFEETGLYHSVCYHLTNRIDMVEPTEIQQRVLKEALHLKTGQLAIDLLVRSPTGSGKTLSYLLPIAHYLLNRPKRITREDGALAIVVVPTHELADQVKEEAERLFRPWHWIVVGSVVGGESKKREKARLRRGISVLIATPGRLLDHMRNTKSFLYRYCEFFVLDEADRLLDLGFETEVKEVVQNLDSQAEISNPGAGKFRSNFLLSATLRKDVEKLAKFSLQEPIEITVVAKKDVSNEEVSKKFSMPPELKQHFCVVEQRYRLATLACFLRLRAQKDVPRGDLSAPQELLPTCKIIVFFSTCDSVDFHFNLFIETKLPNELRPSGTITTSSDLLVPLKLFRIHGNHSQTDRATALREFRKSSRAVLLCTDVAARGLDLKGLTFAIQYDPPTGGDGEELEYLHRAGRTARMGSKGDALLFLLPSERAYVGKLESTGVEITEISGSAALAALYPHANLSDLGGISYATRLVTSAVQESFEKALQSNENLKQEAVAGFQAYCRAYATHAREVRHFFHVRNLHLGHVARAFALSDKPVEFAKMMAEIQSAKVEHDNETLIALSMAAHESKNRGDIARAIAEGEQQPYNLQTTELARRRREKGRGQEALKELALEFGA